MAAIQQMKWSFPEQPHGWPPRARPRQRVNIELWLIVIFIFVIGVGDLRAAKLGFRIGPVPVFLTDGVLLLLLLISFVRWPSRLLFWFSEGGQAGTGGRLAWVLCVLAVIHFALAVSTYKLYAVRDLAIFSYSLFFPLTYFAIRDRRDASRLLHCFVYSGGVLSLLVLLELGGFHSGLFGSSTRTVLGTTISTIADDDACAFSIFALAGLTVYVMLERRRRLLTVGLALASFIAVAASTSRAGIVGLTLAWTLTVANVGHRYWVRCAVLAGLLTSLVVLAPSLPASLPGTQSVQNLRVAIASALSGPSIDPTSRFRLVRWHYAAKLWFEHPVFGAGFGRTIIPAGLVDQVEAGGEFNVGMPHNTFLFIADRTGAFGLAIVLLTWLTAIVRSLFGFHRTRQADELAVASTLAAMFGFAMFVLFFERPVTNAAFWIVAAVGSRLADFTSTALPPANSVSHALDISRA